tara:strand:- start:566 stop:793 length:228 start_codon:yes stop_codon:yes gene_type:complete
MSFVRIVNNYEKVFRLGKKIIKHKETINFIPPEKRDIEFVKQEKRIDQFFESIKNAEKDLEKNKNSINNYWTGLS